MVKNPRNPYFMIFDLPYPIILVEILIFIQEILRYIFYIRWYKLLPNPSVLKLWYTSGKLVNQLNYLIHILFLKK